MVVGNLQAEDSTDSVERTIENFNRINANLSCGSQPQSESHFAKLQKLGFKTVVCVDGTSPNLKMLRKHGLRSVHIPLPYSGIPQESSRMLTKAMRECEKPIFVHCHHGLHRGPAAAAVCGIAQVHFSQKEAVKFLQTVGTDPAYVGLYRDVQNFSVLSTEDDRQLSRIQLLEQAPATKLSDVMVRIESHFRFLKDQATKQQQSNDSWTEHSVAIIEEFKEAGRLYKQADNLKIELQESVQTATSLRLTVGNHERSVALKVLEKSCVQCHAKRR